jgi:RNA polymerase sigma-70 factor (ECF subfamily)
MDDEQLVRQALRGEARAFEALVRRHQRPLFHYLGRMGLGQAETEDLAQEAFLRAYRQLHRFDPGRARFSTWLFTIARRLALNTIARLEHRLNRPLEAADHPVAAEPEAADTRLHERLHAALRTLPLKYRSPLALAYLRDLSIDDIAAVEGCAPGTVKSRIHRAKQQLKSQLADLMGEPEHD